MTITMNKCLEICAVLVFGGALTAAAGQQTSREVAITIDDLPAASSTALSGDAIAALTSRLLATLAGEKVPVVGFVNEKKLFHFGDVDRRIAVLSMWLDDGFELGNHTYSHLSLNQVGPRAWEDDVVQGENVTRLVLAQHNLKLRYFRHPYLHTGRDLQTRHMTEAFLTGRGYQVVPVTLDVWDWMYAPVYEHFKKVGQTALQQRVLTEYLSHSDAILTHVETLSRQTLGYEPKQILLLHVNELESDHIADVLALLRKRGYRVVSVPDALTDPAYRLPDVYIGPEGLGWVERWAITMGKPAGEFPQPSPWMREQYRIYR